MKWLNYVVNRVLPDEISFFCVCVCFFLKFATFKKKIVQHSRSYSGKKAGLSLGSELFF